MSNPTALLREQLHLRGDSRVQLLRDIEEKDREIARLRDRVDELEQQLCIPSDTVPASFHGPNGGPRKTLWKLLCYFADKGMATRDQGYFALYAGKDIEHRPDTKIMDVNIHKLRMILRPRGIDLQTNWGVGWFFSPADQIKAKAFVASFTTEASDAA